MESWFSALIGLGIGAVLGYVFGIQRGDLWVGGTIAVTSSIAGYGFFRISPVPDKGVWPALEILVQSRRCASSGSNAAHAKQYASPR